MKRLMSISGVAVSCFALTAFAQDPANITGTGNFANLDRGDTFVSPAGDVLLDQLYLVDGQAYFAGNGNCVGGEAVFGSTNDLQLCTDMKTETAFDMTDVTTDSVGFLGGAPVAMRVGLFADVGGPDDAYTFDADWRISASSGFTDTIFGLLGVRATGSGSTGNQSAGHWYVMGQPITSGGDGDWYYTARGSQDEGDDCYGRDGDRGVGGYGTTSWVSMAALGFGSGDASMQVIGTTGGGGLDLTFAGECPGAVRLKLSGGQPNGRHGYAYSFRAGSWTVPGGPCAGLELGIVNPTVAAIVPSDSNGTSAIDGNLPPAACGRIFIQGVDVIRGACVASNVISF